jgi:NTP pyrophosphatase (non-canonical NTP hydrolase)
MEAERRMDFGPLLQEILRFRAERDWERFHTPKNLAVSLALEAAELLERFQWTDPPRGGLPQALRPQVEQEAADIAIYLFLFCHDQGIDLAGAVQRKLQLNRQRYPVELSRGRATKYTELGAEGEEGA